jgi:hypothetical protein
MDTQEYSVDDRDIRTGELSMLLRTLRASA